MFRSIALVIIFCFYSIVAESQVNRMPERITFKVTNVSLEEVIQALTKQYSFSFFYSPSNIPLQKKITIDVASKPVKDFFTLLCEQAGIGFTIENGKVILYSDNLHTPSELVSLSGFVTDSLSGERLIGATITFAPLNKGICTNAYGYYAYNLPKGIHLVRCSYLGYEVFEKVLEVKDNTSLNIWLKINSISIREVKLTAKAIDKIGSMRLGQDNLPVQLLKKTPSLFGENDVMQLLKLMPGILSANEVSNGLYVRGCMPQQTSFLLDDAPLFNLYHISGFFSAVNPDALKDVNIYKGHLPGKAGNSLSSVVDLRLRDGNNHQYNVTGAIGTIMSRLTVEGPIVKNKASFILSARRSYLDQLVKLFDKSEDTQRISFYFYDLNAKVNYSPNQFNTFYMSAFASQDMLMDLGGSTWGNRLLSYRWNHLFSSRLFFNLTGTASNYKHVFEGTDPNNYDNKFTTRIRDYNCKLDFSYYLPSNVKLNFGANSNYQDLLPILYQSSNPQISYTFTSNLMQKRLISSVYAESEVDITGNLGVTGSLRMVYLQNVGSTNNASIYPQPGALLRYKLSESSTLKAAFSRNFQLNHGASVIDMLIPFDRYFFTDNYLKPQYADHYSVGYFGRSGEKEIEVSVEPYYSKLYRQYRFDYSDQLFLGTDYQSLAIKGKTRSYGVECSIRKLTGRWTGIVNYTIAWVDKKEDGINQGKYYHPYFDRRHNLLVNLGFDASKKVSLSASWVLTSGNPYHYPTSKYSIRGVTIPLFDDNNFDNGRMPTYHRLDMACKIRLKEHKHYRQSLSFSIYNIYAHRNPVFYNYRDVINGDIDTADKGQNNVGRRFSMVSWYIFQFVPAFSYEFSFF